MNASKRISLAVDPNPQRPLNKRSRSSPHGQGVGSGKQQNSSPTSSHKPRHTRQSISNDLTSQLATIPGSPNASGVSAPATPVSSTHSSQKKKDSPGSRSSQGTPHANTTNGSLSRNRSKSSSYLAHKPSQPQSLSAAVEMLASSRSETHVITPPRPVNGHIRVSTSPELPRNKGKTPSSPRRPIPAVPSGASWSGRNVSSPSVIGRDISGPVLNHSATADMSPVKNRKAGKPIMVASSKNSNSSSTSLPAKCVL